MHSILFWLVAFHGLHSLVDHNFSSCRMVVFFGFEFFLKYAYRNVWVCNDPASGHFASSYERSSNSSMNKRIQTENDFTCHLCIDTFLSLLMLFDVAEELSISEGMVENGSSCSCNWFCYRHS